jgi:2-methylisocitrate lyase-like PEP mutase family enzyme
MTATAAERLRAMHHGSRPPMTGNTGEWPLVLPNVWDPASAREFAAAGFGALATSSAAVAATLGYSDGQTPGEEMLAAVGRIARSVDVPVTADFEHGYDLPPAELASRLIGAGLAGCNLEDSSPVSRALAESARQADFLAAVRAAAGPELVINARIDVFIRPGPAGASADWAVAEAIRRAGAYLAAGADCVYPILAPPDSLKRLVAEIAGPVNAMHHPGGPALAELAAAGIARISFGGGLHRAAMQAVREMAGQLAAGQAGLAGS